MAATRPTSPVPIQEEELPIYWDPRYHAYFYAGAMTPPTGQLYDMRGMPITRPADISTWTVVRLEPTVGPIPRPGAPLVRPVILRVEERGQLKRGSKGRRISWNFPPSPVNQADAPERLSFVTKKRPVYRAVCGGACCAVLLVLTVLIAVSFLIRIFLDLERQRDIEVQTASSDVTTQEGFVLEVILRRRLVPLSMPTASSLTMTRIGRFRHVDEESHESRPATNWM